MDTSRTNEARAPERRGNTRNRRHTQVYFETFFMAGVLSSQSYLQMKTLSAALEQSEEIMQWINVISARARVELQVGLQFWVCCGLCEVLLSLSGEEGIRETLPDAVDANTGKAHLRALLALFQQL
jgi:hypothetical protein